MLLRAANREFRFPRPAVLMGVVNVTPDSFSDGGQFLDADRAVQQALQLAAEGAEILDIGGESTRPGAQPVGEDEELRRVLPVIERLRARTDQLISVDTVKPAVARAAVAAGAGLINDIGGNRTDTAMWRVVAETGAGYVLMHLQGTPATMQQNPHYDDVVAEVDDFFGRRLAELKATGVAAEQVVLDLGIGFGKSAEHNLALLAALDRFMKWARPLLLGVSRKSFIGQIAGPAGPAERLPGSLACACLGIAAGVQILRIHDVAATRQAVRLTEAIRARQPHG